MTRRGDRERLDDIRSAAQDAIEFCAGLDELLSPDIIARYPGVDWRGWAGLRDRASHQYLSLELTRLRPAIVDELPSLLAAVTAELGAAR